MTVTDTPDWMSDGQQVSAQVATGSVSGATGGTPLLTGPNTLINQDSVTVAAGGGLQNLFTSTTRPGYIIHIKASIAATATIPFLKVTMFWQNVATGENVAEEVWYVPASSSGTINVYGKGPMKANSLVVQLENPDPADAITAVVTVLETTHHVARDDWRSDVPNNVPGFTAIGLSDPFALILGSAVNNAAPANSVFTYLLPLYAGQVEISVTQSVAQAMFIDVFALDPTLVGAGFTGLPILVETSPAAKTVGPFPLYLPRCPCMIQIGTGTAASNVQTTVTSLEYAS